MSVEASESANTCMPCHGSGEVISNLGGNPHRVTCPWCAGTGTFIPGRDAQEQPAETQAGASGAPEQS